MAGSDLERQTQAILAKLRRFPNDLEDVVQRAVVQTTNEVEAYAKDHMSPVSPSTPGEPPAVVTGTLKRSLTHEYIKDSRGFCGVVGTNVEYASGLEFGTFRIAARPFMRPALNAKRPTLAACMTQWTQELIRNMGGK
jgi:phage gpG-like protein